MHFFRLKEGSEPDEDDIALCREALEVLAIAIALCPTCLDNLSRDKSWRNFIIDLTLLSPIRSIRITAAEEFALIATRCSGDHGHLR